MDDPTIVPEGDPTLDWARGILTAGGIVPALEGYTSEQLWAEFAPRGWTPSLNEPADANCEVARARKQFPAVSQRSVEVIGRGTIAVIALSLALALAIDADSLQKTSG